VIVKGGSAKKRKHILRKIIGGVLSLFTIGKKGLHSHRHMIVPNAMVKEADHIRSHVMLMNPIDVSALLYMIG
jgi:hypothetical protein